MRAEAVLAVLVSPLRVRVEVDAEATFQIVVSEDHDEHPSKRENVFCVFIEPRVVRANHCARGFPAERG